MDISVSRNQHVCELPLTAIDCATERGFAVAVSRLDIRAAVEQRFANQDVTPSRGHVERCAVLHSILGIDVRSRSYQRADHVPAGLGLACIAYEIQRRVSSFIYGIRVRAET